MIYWAFWVVGFMSGFIAATIILLWWDEQEDEEHE